MLHQLNTTIGEICAYREMKEAITKATRIVTFFNSSHYWGGQLKQEAKQQKISRGLKQNGETRFYSISLLVASIQGNRSDMF